MAFVNRNWHGKSGVFLILSVDGDRNAKSAAHRWRRGDPQGIGWKAKPAATGGRRAAGRISNESEAGVRPAPAFSIYFFTNL